MIFNDQHLIFKMEYISLPKLIGNKIKRQIQMDAYIDQGQNIICVSTNEIR